MSALLCIVSVLGLAVQPRACSKAGRACRGTEQPSGKVSPASRLAAAHAHAHLLIVDDPLSRDFRPSVAHSKWNLTHHAMQHLLPKGSLPSPAYFAILCASLDPLPCLRPSCGAQVCEHLQAFAKPAGVWVVPVVGGMSVPKQRRWPGLPACLLFSLREPAAGCHACHDIGLRLGQDRHSPSHSTPASAVAAVAAVGRRT